MLTYNEFELIREMIDIDGIADINKLKYYHFHPFKSESEIKEIFSKLVESGFIDNSKLTKKAYSEIEHYRVNNAVILAAGGSEVSAKSVYSTPKGLYVKNGETLIERQIRQLKEAGINDITIIIGYKQEMYFFLEDKWGVKLEVNPDIKKNNIYSLYLAKNVLTRTYVCNCDNYFEENPFFTYEYDSFHSVVHKDDAKNELFVDINSYGRIKNVYSGKNEGLCIFGHAFLDDRFTSKLRELMYSSIDDFRVTTLFWEEFVSLHIDDLDMYIRKYDPGFIYEFDSIQEIQNIDSLFLENIGEKINDKICSVLKCEKDDIQNIVILQKGLTNILFTFDVKGTKYIFRYPGDSSSAFIYRDREVRAQILGYEAKVDNTYVYIDKDGIKISKFISGCKNLNGIYYRDIELMKRIAKIFRRYHDYGRNIPDWKEYYNNPIESTDHLLTEASKMKGNIFDIFKKERSDMSKLYRYAEMDNIPKTMCHNDFNQDNCLLTDNSIDFIDWEFAGFNDPAYDFGRVIADYDPESKEIDEILEAYFGRPATEIERIHWIAYMGIHNWYYVGWALYKESINESSRDWMLFFYRIVKKAINYALPRYEKIYGKIE